MLFLRKTSQESINLERKSYLDRSSDTLYTRVNVEGWHIGCRHWGVGNDGRIRNLLWKTQCKGGDISKTKWKIYFSNHRRTNQSFCRRSGTENTHFDTGTSNSRRRSRKFSWRNRRVSSTTPRIVSGCRWSYERFLVHVGKLRIPQSRWTQSQTLLAERRIISHSTEIHWRIQNNKDEHGCHARKPHRRLLEYRWIKRFVWFMDRFHWVYSIGREKPPDGFMWSGLTKRQATSSPDNLRPELWIKMTRNAKLKEKHKWSDDKPKLDNARNLRGIYFIDPEDKEFKETIKNAHKKLEMPMAPAMPCKTSKTCDHGETRGKTNEIKSKLACILEASESTRLRMEESLPHHEDHIAGKGTIHCNITICFAN